MRTRIGIAAGVVAVAVSAIAAWQWRGRSPRERSAQRSEAAPQPQRGATPATASPTVAPMLTPEFSEALEGVLEMEASAAERLEQRLSAHPDDFAARVKLMAYQRRADREIVPGERAKRWKLALWLVQHRPDSEILHSFVAQFAARDLPDEALQQAERLWEAAIRNRPGDDRLLWNAAWFFKDLNTALHLSYLEATAAANPHHPHALLPLAHLYAGALLEGPAPLAQRAEQGLERSRNVWVLGNAAYFLQSHYNQTVMRRASDLRLARLAERYFTRAQAIDPKLDRRAILPHVDPRQPELDRIAAVRSQQRFEAAANEIRRLGVDSFPQLPVGVARVLRSRGCAVPQPAADAGGGRAPANVIRGEFIARGKVGWAVLCSVNQVSTLLVFRSDLDAHPQELSSSEDRNHLRGLGGDAIGYSRQITAVQGDFILRHYRAYGGEKPPPIDHHGIDDAFLGKASMTWYFYRGQWKQLQGAD